MGFLCHTHVCGQIQQHCVKDPMLILLAVVGFSLLVVLVIYNGLIAKKNEIENTFSLVDVQLKLRHDLIPNLVATVKQYMQHEKSTLENIVALRAQAMAPGLSSNQKTDIESKISKGLGSVMIAVENYPTLKADSSFVTLQRSLNEVETQISAARRTYNAAVTEFNNAIEMFPSSVIASMMRLKRASVFAASETERSNVQVDQLFKS